VVGAMRDLAEPRQLAPAQLVEDLPRLLLGELVDLLPLIAREHAERAAREVRIPAERLIRADEPVAAEGHRVPGDAGGRERHGAADRIRRGSHRDLRGPPDAVSAKTLEDQRVAAFGALDGRVDALAALVPADGEHVLERRLELELDPDLGGTRVRVLHADPLA